MVLSGADTKRWRTSNSSFPTDWVRACHCTLSDVTFFACGGRSYRSNLATMFASCSWVQLASSCSNRAKFKIRSRSCFFLRPPRRRFHKASAGEFVTCGGILRWLQAGAAAAPVVDQGSTPRAPTATTTAAAIESGVLPTTMSDICGGDYLRG
jgi:hypothetical protein